VNIPASEYGVIFAEDGIIARRAFFRGCSGKGARTFRRREILRNGNAEAAFMSDGEVKGTADAKE